MHLAKDEHFDKVYLQFLQKRSEDMPISSLMMCQKAVQFHEQLHTGEVTVPPFTASAGWLWRFCNNNGI